MRSSIVVALLLAGTALSGCASSDKIDLTSGGQAINPGGGGGGAGASSEGAAFVFNDSESNITGSAKTQITITGAGTGVGNESATVAVSTGSSMGWADPVEMKLFRDNISGVATDNLGNSANFTGYKEYHTFTDDTDTELQVWSYTNSEIGTYTVYNSPSSSTTKSVAMYYSGSATPTTALPAGNATYNGKFGGTAVVDNWLPATRTIDDPFDTAGTAGSEYDPNGDWRVVGNVQINADFNNGTVNGTVSNTTWRKFTASNTSPDGFITILPAETAKPFTDYTIDGTITDNTFSGTVKAPVDRRLTSSSAIKGGFYGPAADEVAGAIYSHSAAVSPYDGSAPNDTNRRASIKLRGVFQGNR